MLGRLNFNDVDSRSAGDEDIDDSIVSIIDNNGIGLRGSVAPSGRI